MFNLKTIAIKLFRAASTQIMTSISIIVVSVCLIMTMSMYIWNAKTQMEEEIYALFRPRSGWGCSGGRCRCEFPEPHRTARPQRS